MAMPDRAIIGQYWPEDSLVHAMDPRVKFILAFVLMAAVVCAATPLSLAVAALFVVEPHPDAPGHPRHRALARARGADGASERALRPGRTGLLRIRHHLREREGPAVGRLHRLPPAASAHGDEPAHPDHRHARHHRCVRVPAAPLQPHRLRASACPPTSWA